MDIHGNPLTDDRTDLHQDPIVCEGCSEEFCLTIKYADEEKRFCADCFGHYYGIPAYQTIMKTLNPYQTILWTTKLTELPEPVRKMSKMVAGGSQLD